MKINVCIRSWRGGKLHYRLEVRGIKVFEVHDGAPENNTLRRNFRDCLGVPGLLQAAFEAGQKEGKDGIFEIETNKMEYNFEG